MRRFIAGLGIAVAFLLAESVPTLAQGPDYSGYSANVLIPFALSAHPLFTSESPKLRLSVDGPEMIMATIMDTGSTGLALSSNLIPDFATLKSGSGASTGFEFLSSSHQLWVGTWVPLTVTFYDLKDNPVASASVKVLGVETAGVCPSYQAASGEDTCSCQPGTNTCPCPENPNQPTCACPSTKMCKLPPAPPDIHYLGVGFGREYNGFPQGTPDKNALIGISEIQGHSVTGTINQGYIIGTEGVTVGLTTQNTASFEFIPLTHYQPSPRSAPDWSEAQMCVQVTQPGGTPSKCFPGRVLVDTGIDQSYITVPQKLESQGPRPNQTLKSGTTVTLKLPGSSDPVAMEEFTVGQTPAPAWAPTKVIPSFRPCTCTSCYPACTFVNTGRHFLNRYQFLFDAQNGYVGLKLQPSGSGG